MKSKPRYQRGRTFSDYQTSTKKAWQKRRLPLATRIWKKIEKKRSSECWPWKSSTNALGYGTVGVEKVSKLAHRVVWVLKFGEIPNGLCVLHHCDNPACCNPSHLFLGTRNDNNQDRHQKGRSNGPRGENHASAKLNNNDVLQIRQLSHSGTSQRVMARRFKVSRRTIKAVCSRRTWKHIREGSKDER